MTPRALALLAAVALAAATPRVLPSRPSQVLPSATETFEHAAWYDTDAAIAAAEAVEAYFDGRPRDYAGKYLDPVTGDLVVLVTRDSGVHRRALAALTPHPVVVRAAAYARADLIRVVDHVMDRVDALLAQGADVTGGGPDDVANRARILLLHDTPEARRAVLATLSSADGAMVAFERGHHAVAL